MICPKSNRIVTPSSRHAAFYVVAFVKFLGVGAKAGSTLAGRFFLTL
jgi:hypothetical protein